VDVVVSGIILVIVVSLGISILAGFLCWRDEGRFIRMVLICRDVVLVLVEVKVFL
jgi:hypothetical protein